MANWSDLIDFEVHSVITSKKPGAALFADFAKRRVLGFSFHRIHSKKVFDNRYTDVITSCMLPRKLTLPTHPLAKLTPSLPYSCRLFAFVPKLPFFRINHLQPLFAKHPGGGVPAAVFTGHQSQVTSHVLVAPAPAPSWSGWQIPF